ncbi:SDR family NAD(P)-dependent oxidoreductase [Antarctobacter heliothermus]|uniref:NAD(P)-dependent dehydrogenase, short-chain alcohol dehydrogenase family n=1 Tax=Antarctobacter heliothermus TaxID=74033 RepID=A0A239FU87_9RHOB|nr:SDR family oxidoreductase [Antarctobacter heliothermus]SNS60379.1 NAD(P)-dependent dehydrogenase, short-chain alcohol dehydrogenase family [Antarctobacter heliothermus]
MPVAVITGGNKGLGLAQSRRFLEAGFDVFVVARSRGDVDSAEGAQFVECDLAADRAADWLGALHGRVGTIAALVNNAGVHLKKPIWDVAPDELDRVLDINVRAMFAACGRYVDLHRETGGAVVNIASMGGIMALPSAAAYVTAKTAVVGLTRSVAVDAAPFGIRCNAVSPGFIETDMTRAILAKDPARRDKIEGRIPSHAFGTPQDVADAVFYLASDRAAYVNGVNLPVDGGYAVGF